MAPSPRVQLAESTASPHLTPSPFSEVAPQTRAAVVIVSVFDQSGRLRANSHGFFVSADGRFIADRRVLEGGINAVAKAANGGIYNVAGALRESGECVLLKADVKSVPYLEANNSATLNVGDRVAAILSPVERGKHLLEETTIAARFSDGNGAWFDVSPTIPKSASGAPVVDRRGKLVGVAVCREAGSDACVIRPVSVAANLVSQVTPSTIASWQSFAPPAPSATASASAARSPTPAKIPLRGSRLAYAPPPRYPVELRRSHWAIRASGDFRINFDGQGRAVTVQVLHSTGNALLDRSALEGLHNWRAEPGQTWSLNVPVTFTPR